MEKIDERGKVSSTTANLLKNPGFEEIYNLMPKYWSKYQTGTNAVFTYTEIGRTGTGKSVAIKYATREAGKVALWTQSGITVNSSKQYKLSGYMKLYGVRDTHKLKKIVSGNKMVAKNKEW